MLFRSSAVQLALLLAAALTSASLISAEDLAIDAQRSTITIHVGKAGLFSAAGHEHWISAPISSGALRESPDPHVEFAVETATMAVKPHPRCDTTTQAALQKDIAESTPET